MSISQRNLSGYDLPPIEWERVREAMATTDHTQAPDTGGPNRHTTWLTTLNPDGTPHVTPIGRVQIDGVDYTISPGAEPRVLEQKVEGQEIDTIFAEHKKGVNRRFHFRGI
jgi:hypothetical protein